MANVSQLINRIVSISYNPDKILNVARENITRIINIMRVKV